MSERIEIRYSDGVVALDEIVLKASDGEVVMHLEYLDDDQIMLLLFAGSERWRVTLESGSVIGAMIECEGRASTGDNESPEGESE